MERDPTKKKLPLSSLLQKRNETASEKLKWVVEIKHDHQEEQLFKSLIGHRA